MTDPGFILFTSAADTSFGADAPGISTPPMTRSALVTWFSTASCVENTVLSGRPNCRHSARSTSTLRSSTHTSAPMPSAMWHACEPTTPPPRITTFAGSTPGTPPSSMPRPPCGFSR